MLNTSTLIKNNKNDILINETILDKGIRKIDEITNLKNEMYNENKIFETNDIYLADEIYHIDNFNFNEIIKKSQNENKINDIYLADEIYHIDNFNFNEIIKKSQNENKINDIFDNKKLFISINEKLGKICIFDNNNNLGFFTVQHIIKYLSHIYDTKNQFMKHITDNNFIKAKELIKIFIFKLQYNKQYKNYDIILKDYKSSGFMGNIELLIKLNNLLYNYKLEELNNDLLNVNLDNKIKIEQNIKKFIYILLNYTHKLLSIISEQIKNKQNNEELKEMIINYSISIVSRINLFVQEQLKVINDQNTYILKSINISKNLKKNIITKLNLLLTNLNKSNESNYDYSHNDTSTILY